jgi:hypothetical protein
LVPVIFANSAGITQAVHYYAASEFTRKNISRHIVDKTLMIGRQCGAIWAFPVTDNRKMLKPIARITRETGIFRDFYIDGTVGHTMNLGGSLTEHLPLNTNYAATFPVHPAVSPTGRERQVAGDVAADGSGKKRTEDKMEKPMPEGKNLDRERHMALVEFLGRCAVQADNDYLNDYVREITAVREFKFLEDFFPPCTDTSWSLYKEKLEEAHARELRSYTERFPDEPYHGFTYMLFLLEAENSVTRTPLDFLSSCAFIEDSGTYRDVYGDKAPFPQGSVRAVSPQKIALFHEGAALPLFLLDNTPENWANLYTKANNSGINVNGMIPTPEDVENRGTSILRASEDRLRNAMSEEWQEEKFRKDCALVQSMEGGQVGKHQARDGEAQRESVRSPYVPGVEVPPLRP